MPITRKNIGCQKAHYICMPEWYFMGFIPRLTLISPQIITQSYSLLNVPPLIRIFCEPPAE